MPNPSKKTIGAYEFTFGQLPAWQNFAAFHAFLKILGPAAPPVIQAALVVMKKGGTLPKTPEEWTAMAVGLIGTIPQVLFQAPYEEVEQLAKSLLKNVVVTTNGKSAPALDVIDSLMQGQLMNFVELLGWCVTEAFGGFFSDAAAMLSRMPGAKKPVEQSPKAAPSTSSSPSA
jgi:hypothetical protein